MAGRNEVNVFNVSIAMQRRIGDLPRLEELREELRSLPADAVPVERARLHLAAAVVMQDRQEGGTRSAIEEARQAVELLSAEGGPALAAARYHLGRLVLIVAVGDPARPPDPAALAEARHFLEQARADFEALGDIEALALTAVELAHVAEREGEIDTAFEVLDTELRRAPANTRGILSLWKATIGLGHAAYRRAADAAVAAFLKEDARTETDEVGLCQLLGMFHDQISHDTATLALAWLEARPQPPLHQIIVLRSTLAPGAPETWIRPDERAELEASLGDPNTPPNQRWHVAHLLMFSLPEAERDPRLRCAEMLEEAILSPEVPAPQATGYRHDVGVAYLNLARGDRQLVARAVEHLTAVVDQVRAWDQADVVVNLASAHAALLEIDAALSSPALLDHVRLIEEVLARLPATERGRACGPRIIAAQALLRWHALTQVACLGEARRLLREVLSHDPTDGDALRFTYLAAWCAHMQGRGALAAVDVARAAAERVGTVSDARLVPPPGESMESFATLVRVLAGTEPPGHVKPSSLASATGIRPDAVDLLLDATEERARVGFGDDSELGRWLETVARALQASLAGDTTTRARRMSALVVSLAPRLTAGRVDRILSLLRGPIGSEVEQALRASGVVFEAGPTTETEARPLAEKVREMQARGVGLFQKAQEIRDEARAVPLFEEARRLLDEAVRLARPLEKEQRATIQLSAGNARRHLAAVQPDRARPLLDEAIALYREALSWTTPGSDARGQASKLLAQVLISRGIAADWNEARQLFSEALEIRRSGQLRAETLMAVIDAELAHPTRSRVASAAAALGAACEAMEHVVSQMEQMRLEIGGRAVSLLAELVREGGLEPPEATRHAERIAAVSPKLVKHARLAAFGLTEAGLREEDSRVVTSEFARAFVVASMSGRASLADQAMPPHLADEAPPTTPSDRPRRNDATALRREQERWRTEAAGAHGETRAGYLAGVAHLVERRAELGDASRDELEAAFEEAHASLPGIASLEIRAFALSEVAVVWSGHHAARDFARAARLLEESLRLFREAGSDAGIDAVQYLARATRYREDMPRGQAVKRAIHMLEDAAKEYRARGKADGYMSCLLNLAESLDMQEDRPRATAIKEAIAVDRMAIEIARLRGDRAHLGLLLGNMAWSLTRLANDSSLPMAERERHWEEAGPLFDEAEKLSDDPGWLAGLRNNRLSWEEVREGSPAARIEGRRRQLASIDSRTHPHRWSFAAHNLAEALIYPGASAAEIREALDRYRSALALRPIQAVPELHWECAHQIGALLGGQRYPGELPTLRDLGISPDEAHREAREMLRAAIAAGRALGAGGKLVTAARTLGLVAAEPPGHLACDVASAHEALECFADVLRVAPDDAPAADAEAEVARALVMALAKQRATGATRTGCYAVLEGAAAWELVHLVLRARGGRHRRLRMRLSRPDGVDPATWTRWRRVLHERNNFEERRQIAAEVQKEAPDFLAPTPSLRETLRWLQEGRAAASLVTNDATMLLIVLRMGETGPSASAVVADLPLCPILEAAARDLFLSAVAARRPEHTAARAKVAELHGWLAATVVDALKLVLPAGITELCWSPNGIAAWVPLEVVWPDGPRVWTTPCLTHPPPVGAATTSHGALLVCADPRAPGTPGALPDAPAIVAQLADSLAGTADAEVLAASGRAYGRSLLPAVRPELIADRPPSRDEVLARVQGRRLLLILAHGTYDPEEPARSAFHLVDADGHETPLTAENISERPGLLRDTVVVLLSCESGASGRLDAGPAGLAGALLSVGAKVVIAPLWVVSLVTAVRVGRAVVEHLARGLPVESLPDAVKAARRELDAEYGPDDALHGPFVVWCG